MVCAPTRLGPTTSPLPRHAPCSSVTHWHMLLCHPLAPAGHSGGYVVGEVIRRVTGCTLRDFVTRELASPLGVEFYMGVPNSHVMSRVSKVKCSIPPPCQLLPMLLRSVAKNLTRAVQVQPGLARQGRVASPKHALC